MPIFTGPMILICEEPIHGQPVFDGRIGNFAHGPMKTGGAVFLFRNDEAAEIFASIRGLDDGIFETLSDPKLLLEFLLVAKTLNMTHVAFDPSPLTSDGMGTPIDDAIADLENRSEW